MMVAKSAEHGTISDSIVICWSGRIPVPGHHGGGSVDSSLNEDAMEMFLNSLFRFPIDFIGAWSMRNNRTNWNSTSHKHGYFEMLYFQDGQADICFGADLKQIKPFNMVLYPPGLKHKEVPDFGHDLNVICLQMHIDSTVELSSSFQVTDYNNNLRGMFEEILNEYQNRSLHFREIANNLCRNILYLSGRYMKNNQGRPNEIVNRCILFIHDNYSEHIDLEALARIAYASSSYIERIFNLELGTSPIKYIRQVRIEAAKKMICLETIPINDVATRVGFDDPLYFSRVFHQLTGLSPREYRKEHASTQKTDK
jgi:AraC family transcriptional regulator, arabinose operon regulatory protein